MSKIFVMDGRAISSLAIIRSFGEKGFEVHCGDEFKNNLSSFSKYVNRIVTYPSPRDSPEIFIEFILELLKKEKYDMIIPIRDETTLLLSQHKSQIAKHTLLYLADSDTISNFIDKGKTIKIAMENGIPTPKTYFPEDTDVDTIKSIIKFPILIRSRISSGSRGIIYVGSSSEFDEAYYKVKNEYGEPIIQEYINKTGYSTACILLDEKQSEIACFSYKRIKEYPITGGPTVVGISSDDSLVKEHSLKLLKNNNWKGCAEIEYILDEKGNPLLLEVNPRFWMPLNLAIKSGVDFPYLMYNLAIGKHVEPILSYKVGLKYRWVIPYEILWLLNTPNKARGITEFINFWDKNTCYGVLSKDDPKALLGIFVQSMDFLFNTEKRNLIFKRGW